MMRQNVFIYFPADTYLGRISLPLPSAIADQQGEAAHARLYTLGVCSEVTFSAGEKEFSSCKRWLEIGPRPSGPASCPGGAACRLQNGWSFKAHWCPASPPYSLSPVVLVRPMGPFALAVS